MIASADLYDCSLEPEEGSFKEHQQRERKRKKEGEKERKKEKKAYGGIRSDPLHMLGLLGAPV